MESDPPETVISDSVKSVEASERVKVREAVSPAFKEEASELTAMVGLTVSTVRVRDCQFSTLQKLCHLKFLVGSKSDHDLDFF